MLMAITPVEGRCTCRASYASRSARTSVAQDLIVAGEGLYDQIPCGKTGISSWREWIIVRVAEDTRGFNTAVQNPPHLPQAARGAALSPRIHLCMVEVEHTIDNLRLGGSWRCCEWHWSQWPCPPPQSLRSSRVDEGRPLVGIVGRDRPCSSRRWLQGSLARSEACRALACSTRPRRGRGLRGTMLLRVVGCGEDGPSPRAEAAL